MAQSRYSNAETFNNKQYFGTSKSILKIRNAVKDGTLSVREDFVRGSQRLDHISFQAYGDEKYWWVIAAASGIGWGTQLTADTPLLIPVNIKDALALI